MALAGPVPLNQKPPAMPRPTSLARGLRRAVQGRVPMVMLPRRLDGFQPADAAELRPGDPAVTLFGAVPRAELQLVHPDGFADFVHHRLHGKGRRRRAGGAVSRRFGGGSAPRPPPSMRPLEML